TTKEVTEARTVALTDEQIESKWQYEDPEAPCFNGPEQPDPQRYTDRGERFTCPMIWGWYEVYEVPTVYDPETRTWVPGEPILLESGEDMLRRPSVTELIENDCIVFPPPPNVETDDPKDDGPRVDRPICETADDLKNDPRCKNDLPKGQKKVVEDEELAVTGPEGAAMLALLGLGALVLGAVLFASRKRFMQE